MPTPLNCQQNKHLLPEFKEDDTFLPAVKVAIKALQSTVQAITQTKVLPTFQNTVLPLEDAFKNLFETTFIPYSLNNTDTSTKRQQIIKHISSLTTQMYADIYQNAELFKRFEKLLQQQNLPEEEHRLCKKYQENFINYGIALNTEQKKRLNTLNEKLNELSLNYQENLQNNIHEHSVFIRQKNALEGLSATTCAQLKNAAEKSAKNNKNHQNGYLITPTNSTVHPLLKELKNRPLREQIYKAHIARGTKPGDTTWQTAQELHTYRQEKATLLGYKNYADLTNSQQTAPNVDAVFALLTPTFERLQPLISKQVETLTELFHKDGHTGPLQPWDFPYYAHRYKKQNLALNMDTIQDYFELNNILENGIFFMLNKLYGVTFEEVEAPTYHEDVRVYNIYADNKELLGLFYFDPFTRTEKNGGAWCSSLRPTYHKRGCKSVVMNVLNIPKGPKGKPTLLNYEHVITLFHEIGHAMHIFLTKAQYVSNAGTLVPRDFVEMPAMLHQYFAFHPEIMANYAHHHQTKEPLTEELREHFLKAIRFDELFIAYEYLSAALLDLEAHKTEAPISGNITEVTNILLKKYNMHPAIMPRYGLGYFAHIYSSAYTALYYGYIWAEIFAADMFDWLKNDYGLTREAGDLICQILNKGNSCDLVALYEEVRGQKPNPNALLRQMGLITK